MTCILHRRRLLATFVLGILVAAFGCIPPADPADGPVVGDAAPGGVELPIPTAEPPAAKPPEEPTAPVENEPPKPPEVLPPEPIPLPEVPPEPMPTWDDLLRQTTEGLQRDALDEAQATLAALKKLDVALSAEQTERLAAAEAELQHGLDLRQLGAAVQMLASADGEKVQRARNRLSENPGAALPLLREAVGDENPLLVKNALETLLVMGPPEDVAAIAVEVLTRAEQAANWPDAIGVIERIAGPGAGEPLLTLALASDNPDQRMAALEALAVSVDPPGRTVVALLPMIAGDGPELAGALVAAGHSVAVHHQHDLVAGRGLEGELTADQWKQLSSLPERLSKIIAADNADPPGPAAAAARGLAMTTRQIPAEPLLGIRIVGYGGQTRDGAAAAVLDGVWNASDRKAMWRHPVDKPASIVLDLGRRRTIAGVRIWNLNEPGGAHRGWKDVAVCVGSTPTELVTPSATGIVPQAPGKPDSPDFSTTIPVDFIPGRYIRLKAESLWRADSHAGLAEVQVLGF